MSQPARGRVSSPIRMPPGQAHICPCHRASSIALPRQGAEPTFQVLQLMRGWVSCPALMNPEIAFLLPVVGGEGWGLKGICPSPTPMYSRQGAGPALLITHVLATRVSSVVLPRRRIELTLLSAADSEGAGWGVGELPSRAKRAQRSWPCQSTHLPWDGVGAGEMPAPLTTCGSLESWSLLLFYSSPLVS